MSPTIPTAKTTSGHPVADNAVRLLFGEGWSTLRDLRQNAKRLALQARRGSLQPPEPCGDDCPRVRCEEDYAVAQKVLSDPSALAIAVAFLPDDWQRPQDAISQANVDLLRAEGLPAGDPGRAGLVAGAVRVWDGPAGEAQVNVAIEFAAHEEMLGTRPPAADVATGVYGALAKVAERALADVCGGVREEHLGLLTVLEGCHRVPEVRGLRAKEEWAFGELWTEGMKPFIDASEALFGQEEFLFKAQLSPEEINLLVESGGNFRQAWALAQRCPGVERRFRSDTFSDYETRRLLAAWTVGTNTGAWAQAGQLMDGVGPKAAEELTNLREILLLARQAVPILAQAQNSRAVGLASKLEAMKPVFPDFTHLLTKLSAGVWLLCQGQRATLADCERALEAKPPPATAPRVESAPSKNPPALPKPATTRQNPVERFLGEQPTNAHYPQPPNSSTPNWGCIAVIGVGVIFLMILISQPNSTPT